MKIKYYLLIMLMGIASISFDSCQSLDLEPKGILGEKELLGNQSGVQKYFTGLYNFMPIEDFVYFARSGNSDDGGTSGFRAVNYWEAVKYRLQNMSGEFVNTWQQVNNDGHGYWPYDKIRDINVFIAAFPAYRESYTPEEYKNYWGEVHFIRAFYYFALVKRYGGIPIITDVQDPQDAPEKLQVARNTEYDTWKFIHDDLVIAIDNLSDKKDIYRANKFTAAALMNRAMLYAATIAKYSQYLGYEQETAYQQGFAGINADKANEFFQYAYDAGKLVETGGYSLYKKNGDLAQNFADLFLDVNSSENIFIKGFSRNAPRNMRLCHTWDSGMLPNPELSNFVGSQSYPALDMMRLYDFPDIVDADGNPIRFTNRGDIREGMEPRLRGSMWFNGDVLRNVEFSIQRGNYKTFNWKASTIGNGDNNDLPNKVIKVTDPQDPSKQIDISNRILSYDRSASFNLEAIGSYIRPVTAANGAYRYQGNHGTRENAGGENNCFTGAFVRKYVDPTNANTGSYGSSQHWVVFRLGEIYANMAEICYEMGKESEAFDYIEQLRIRAGAKVTRPSIDKTPYNGEPNARYNAYTYPYTIDASLKFIRDERYRELWGENHRWWDLRRWRVVDRVLNQYRPRALSCYYIIDENKYIYLDERIKEGSTWTASRASYYEGIPQSQINMNRNLLPQNPLR